MKKIFKYALLFAAVYSCSAILVSCDSDKNDDQAQTISEGDQYLQKVLAADVDNTINPTYKALADSCELLYNQLSALKPGDITQKQVNDVCKTFLNARACYERSEAFLLGAAAHFNIDPHIDSWPLDLTALHTYLTGDVSVSIKDESMLGFHGIEFILFRDGQPRKASELNGNDTYNEEGQDFTIFSGKKELGYAKTVAEDLRNSVFRLQCSWNENAAKARFDLLEELGKTYVTDKGTSYGINLRNAGDPAKSTYATIKLAVSSVLTGDNSSGGIADEVGNVKINNPYSGKDVNYIESPYSYNSLTDFTNNIHSIENIWYGGVAGNRSEYSFSNYFKKYDPATGARVETAIMNAIAKIKAIPSPFVKNFKSAKCADAIKACQEVSDALAAAAKFIVETNK